MTGAHDCEQICNNLPVFWQCSCNPGYRLRTDGRTCQGKGNYELILYQ